MITNSDLLVETGIFQLLILETRIDQYLLTCVYSQWNTSLLTLSHKFCVNLSNC